MKNEEASNELAIPDDLNLYVGAIGRAVCWMYGDGNR